VRKRLVDGTRLGIGHEPQERILAAARDQEGHERLRHQRTEVALLGAERRQVPAA
jgi:hypothetical protein